jgi:hypothetical protein
VNKKLTSFITMLSSCVALAFPVGLAAQDKVNKITPTCTIITSSST